MDHVNIISQKAITMIAPELSNVLAIFGFLMIVFLVGCYIYSFKLLNDRAKQKTLLKVTCWISGVGLTVLLVSGIIGSVFFRVPTGRYRYEATIDKENMTVAEYEEFMKAYNHSLCKNGIYYFED